MARFEEKPKVTAEYVVRITEGEFRALNALFSYNMTTFIESFYQHMGKSLLEPYEEHLLEFAKLIRSQAHTLGRVDDARKVFEGTHDATKR